VFYYNYISRRLHNVNALLVLYSSPMLEIAKAYSTLRESLLQYDGIYTAEYYEQQIVSNIETLRVNIQDIRAIYANHNV